jgi:hypothetical protein
VVFLKKSHSWRDGRQVQYLIDRETDRRKRQRADCNMDKQIYRQTNRERQTDCLMDRQKDCKMDGKANSNTFGYHMESNWLERKLHCWESN